MIYYRYHKARRRCFRRPHRPPQNSRLADASILAAALALTILAVRFVPSRAMTD